MEENKKNVFTKKGVLKIIIPFVIVFCILIIWAIKNEVFSFDQTKDTKDDKSVKTSDLTESDDFALNVEEEIDLEQLKSYGVPIIIDFGADSCIPCKEIAPILEKLNSELRGKAIIKFVDVWKYEEIGKNYPISVIPTQLLIDKDGNPYIPSDTYAEGMTMYSSQDTKEHIYTTHQGGITEEQLLGILKEMGMQE